MPTCWILVYDFRRHIAPIRMERNANQKWLTTRLNSTVDKLLGSLHRQDINPRFESEQNAFLLLAQ